MRRKKKSPSAVAARYQIEQLEQRQLLAAISSGQRLVGNISTIGQQDSYTFSANAGDSIIAVMGDLSGSISFTARIDLRAPDGSLVGTQIGNTGASVDALNVAQSGTYTIVAHEDGDNFTGSYAVSMLRLPAAQAVDADSGPITSGVTVNGSIDLGDVDVYTFDANAGDTVLVALGDTTNSSFSIVHLQVYAPNGGLLGSSTSNTGTSVNLSNVALTGTYYIVARELSDDVAYTYSLTMLHLPGAQPATGDSGPISSGERKLGAIDLGDLDVYTFTANAGDSILTAIGDTAVNNTTIVQIQVYAPNGALLGDNFSNTGASINLSNVAFSGTYYIVAREQGDDVATPYALTMIRMPATQTVDADSGPITSGQRLQGAIDPGDLDVHTFTANAGDTILVGLGDTGGSNSSTVELEVYGPNGVLLGASQSNTGTSVSISNAASTGTYYIVARELNDDFTYTYAVSLLRLPAAQITDSDSGPIDTGVTRTGSIDIADMDVYTFTANTGDSVLVALGDTTGSNSSTAQLQVFAPNGVLLGSSISNTGTSVDLLNVPSSGTYYIVVREVNDDFTYNYALTMLRLPSAQPTTGDSGPIASGQRLLGSIGLGDLDVYTVDANAGDTLLLAIGDTSNSNSTTAQVQLYAPNGALLQSTFANTGASIDMQNVPQTGRYYIVCREYLDDFDYTYAISMLHLPAEQASDADSVFLHTGERHSGYIDLGDLDVYTFNAVAGDSIAIVMGDTGGSNSTTAQVQLYSPTGALLASNAANTGAGIDQQNLAQTGVYYIVAREYLDDIQLPYAISLFRTPVNLMNDGESGPIGNGQMRSGMIDMGDIDEYTFNANAGDAVSVIAGDTSGNNGITVQAQLFAPNGALLGSNLNNFGTAIDISNVPLSGTYTIVIREAGDDFTMPYSVSLVHAPGTQTLDPTDNDNGLLALGQTRTGAISLGDSDVYTLNLTAGAAVNLQMNRLTGGNGFAPRLMLLAPNGARLADVAGAASAAINLASVPVTGTYYLVARESGDDGVGTYSLGLNVAPGADTRAPGVQYAQYDYDSVPPRILLSVNEAITAAPTTANVKIENLTQSFTVPIANYTVAFNAPSNQIVITLTGYTATRPPDGNYRVTLAAGSITDGINALPAPATADFFVFAGDANRDRVIDDKDLYFVGANWMSPGDRFSQGDFNRDGVVNAADLTLVALKWQTTLAPAAPPPAQPLALTPAPVRAPTRTATRIVDLVL